MRLFFGSRKEEGDQIEIKLNIGCGPSGQFHGYINIDNSPSVLLGKFPRIKKVLFKLGAIKENQYEANWSGVFRCDVTKGIPYGSSTVDKIYSSHMLEHINHDNGLFFIKECYRVLKPGGVLRLVVPDLLWYAEKYVERTQKVIGSKELPDDRTAHDDFLNTIYGAYLKKRRYGAEHYFMYDLPTLVFVLKAAGFENIKKYAFKIGSDMELAFFDSRPEESLYMEGIK